MIPLLLVLALLMLGLGFGRSSKTRACRPKGAPLDRVNLTLWVAAASLMAAAATAWGGQWWYGLLSLPLTLAFSSLAVSMALRVYWRAQDRRLQ